MKLDPKVAQVAAGGGFLLTKMSGRARKLPRHRIDTAPWRKTVGLMIVWSSETVARRAEKQYRFWSVTVRRRGAITHASDALIYSVALIGTIGIERLISVQHVVWPIWAVPNVHRDAAERLGLAGIPKTVKGTTERRPRGGRK